jgi:hypothetical protein
MTSQMHDLTKIVRLVVPKRVPGPESVIVDQRCRRYWRRKRLEWPLVSIFSLIRGSILVVVVILSGVEGSDFILRSIIVVSGAKT